MLHSLQFEAVMCLTILCLVLACFKDSLHDRQQDVYQSLPFVKKYSLVSIHSPGYDAKCMLPYASYVGGKLIGCVTPNLSTGTLCQLEKMEGKMLEPCHKLEYTNNKWQHPIL